VCHPGRVTQEPGLPEGIYESLITRRLARILQSLGDERVKRTALNDAEAPDRVALHLARQIERHLASLSKEARAASATAVVETVLRSLKLQNDAGFHDDELLSESAEVLEQILRRGPDGSLNEVSSPLVPLLDSTVLTNAHGEPNVGKAIISEVESSQSIDVIMAFITKSGILPLEAVLTDHCNGGKRLRVITTTYTGITQRAALDRLTEIGAEIRVSYDTTKTRLHAKAWTFHRPEGMSTAYIGSSNLTHQAQVTGLEWNIRVSGARNPHVIDKMKAVFDTYWESHDFVRYDPDEFDRRTTSTSSQGQFIAPVAIQPLPFQSRMLELLQLERERGRHRNLLVSATGTGKTVMSALDYLALREALPGARLLFVAHRKEILEQSLAVFRQAMLDANFGEMWVAGSRPIKFDHVFASIQTLNSQDIERLDPGHFDVVVIDEFHHAAADSYQRLLGYVQPRELLGLTATPERADGQSILSLFDNRIAAELRLWDAIDAGYLSSFAYYGIHDGTDLSSIPWKRGKGYDTESLANVYTADDLWAKRVVKEFVRHVDNPESVRALGFCVSVKHAEFMAKVFNEHGLSSVSVDGSSPQREREDALRSLREGTVRVVFSVDLFNEGVDVPAVDALLMLRPTDSPVLFLQQLGRGLRRHFSKSQCTVLDFVGHHHNEYRFDRRFGALFGGTRKEVLEQVKNGFPFLPAGCHMELDKVASEIVLENLKTALPTKWSQRVAEMKKLASRYESVSLDVFLNETGLSIDDVYDGTYGFSDLLEAAGLPVLQQGPAEKEIRKAVGRLLHVDDQFRLDLWYRIVSLGSNANLTDPILRRLAQMLAGQLLSQVKPQALSPKAGILDGWHLLIEHPQVCREIQELFPLLKSRIDHIAKPVPGNPDLPLRIHARYTRIEILAAFGASEGWKSPEWREGVKWLPDAKADLFAFTIDKSTGSFSPSTRYRDYAISPSIIHWESQSTTRTESVTGRRYANHVKMGTTVHLFAREHQNERAFWYLGPATYISHEGDCPMAIKWRLQTPLPGDLFGRLAA